MSERVDERVEQVARAMFEALRGDTHNAGWTVKDAYENNRPHNASDGLKERLRKMARAAVEEMDLTP